MTELIGEPPAPLFAHGSAGYGVGSHLEDRPRQSGKVARGLAALEAAPPLIDAMPNVGQITLACTLGYRDFRFGPGWRGDHPYLVAWLDSFAGRVPAFAATKPA